MLFLDTNQAQYIALDLTYCIVGIKVTRLLKRKTEEHCLGNGMQFALFIFMPRKPRIEFDRAVYHVMSRSNRQARV